MNKSATRKHRKRVKKLKNLAKMVGPGNERRDRNEDAKRGKGKSLIVLSAAQFSEVYWDRIECHIITSDLKITDCFT